MYDCVAFERKIKILKKIVEKNQKNLNISDVLLIYYTLFLLLHKILNKIKSTIK